MRVVLVNLTALDLPLTLEAGCTANLTRPIRTTLVEAIDRHAGKSRT